MANIVRHFIVVLALFVFASAARGQAPADPVAQNPPAGGAGPAAPARGEGGGPGPAAPMTCGELAAARKDLRPPQTTLGFATIYQPGAGIGRLRIPQSAGTPYDRFLVCVASGKVGVREWQAGIRSVNTPPDKKDPILLDIDFGNTPEANKPVLDFPWSGQTIVVAAWERGKTDIQDASIFLIKTTLVWPGLGTRIAVIVAVALAAFFLLSLVSTRILWGPKGRPSLTNLQILWFSCVVIVLVAHGLADTGTIASISEDVLLLMGIGATSAVLAKIADQQKNRLSLTNYFWIKDKVAEGKLKLSPIRPCLLCDEAGTLDVFRIQAAVFSVFVGIALLLQGFEALGNFHISQEMLWLLGISQVTYVGGKLAQPPTFSELDKMITAEREAPHDPMPDDLKRAIEALIHEVDYQ